MVKTRSGITTKRPSMDWYNIVRQNYYPQIDALQFLNRQEKSALKQKIYNKGPINKKSVDAVIQEGVRLDMFYAKKRERVQKIKDMSISNANKREFLNRLDAVNPENRRYENRMNLVVKRAYDMKEMANKKGFAIRRLNALSLTAENKERLRNRLTNAQSLNQINVIMQNAEKNARSKPNAKNVIDSMNVLEESQRNNYKSQVNAAGSAKNIARILSNAKTASKRAMIRVGMKRVRNTTTEAITSTAKRMRDATGRMMTPSNLRAAWHYFDPVFEKFDAKLTVALILAAVSKFGGETAVNRMFSNISDVPNNDILMLIRDDRVVGRVVKYKKYFKPGYISVDVLVTFFMYIVLLRSLTIFVNKAETVKRYINELLSTRVGDYAFGLLFRTSVWASVKILFDVTRVLLAGETYMAEVNALKRGPLFTKFLVYMKLTSERMIGDSVINKAFNVFRTTSETELKQRVSAFFKFIMDLPVIGPISRNTAMGFLETRGLRMLGLLPSSQPPPRTPPGSPSRRGGDGKNAAPNNNSGQAPVNVNSARRTSAQMILTSTTGTRYRFQNQRDVQNIRETEGQNRGGGSSTDVILTNEQTSMRYRVTRNQLDRATRI